MKRKFSVAVTSQHDTASLLYNVLYDGSEMELLQAMRMGRSVELSDGGRLSINDKMIFTIMVKGET